ncbi:MAG: hypothetical protein LBK28_07620 [Propionibacteriaceae bacterium]|jgi:hypothetical protein|nr:hypothetical protein [Propionibacteriaceae bacterium]
MRPGFELATVLITVKTYPNPSDRYGETVCVAGARLDGGIPTWIRLYPMKHRLAEYTQKFKKYDLIEIPVSSHGAKDPRPESMRPDQTGLRLLGHVESRDGWRERRELLAGLIGATTTCDLIAANKAVTMADPAPSLGLVRATEATVRVRLGKTWDARQRHKAEAAASPTLFDDQGQEVLEPMPFSVVLSYRCDAERCPGHEATVLDWEVGQAGRKWRVELGDAGARTALRDKWTSMFASGKDSHLFVGNMHQRRQTFSVLGVWYPRIPVQDSLL